MADGSLTKRLQLENNLTPTRGTSLIRQTSRQCEMRIYIYIYGQEKHPQHSAKFNTAQQYEKASCEQRPSSYI